MKVYNVNEIAYLLNVTDETVRRWIRSGKLSSTMKSKKNGNIIEEHDLNEFLMKMPKYGRIFEQDKSELSSYEQTLIDLLDDLIRTRDGLNERINEIQTLLNRV